MQWLLTVCSWIAAVIGALYAYRVIFAVVGLFFRKKYAPAARRHHYAVIIAARNEEAVIGNLLDSIAAQDYPTELMTVFVVADNCTDGTAQAARARGAVVYERKDPDHCTKGYALEYLFDRIEEDYGRARFEGYFVFDADNLLARDYVSRMNDAFDGGERLIVSYRATKNLGDGWLSAGYALHWVRTARLEHCARSYFGVSCRVQGTGFLVDSALLRDGWHYTSLTEDRALSSDAVAGDVTVSYQHDAVFYDEQPTSLRVACRQRLRWAKGHLQSFFETCGALTRGIVRRENTLVGRISCYDMLTCNFPSSVITVPLKLIEAGITVALCILGGRLGQEWLMLLWQVLYILVFEHLSAILMGFVLFFLERRRLRRVKWWQVLWYSLMFPLFSIIGDIATLVAVFVKVTWKPIPHKADIAIGELETGGENTRS